MGKHSLRTDKTCLNCHHVVENRFCPNCGQENKETKESFHYLFFHTVEDLVHYDSGFWKTIKYLLFYPAKLTNEYIKGRRKMFVPPVKLYIFISFITFFILSILSSVNSHQEVPITANKTQQQITKDGKIRVAEAPKNTINIDTTNFSSGLEENNGEAGKWLNDKFRNVAKHAKDKDFVKKFYKTLFSTIPKALFIFMPLFAFVLWLFHNKKKWYYFDSGIFTIHYFSMILLSFTINALLSALFSKVFDSETADTLNGFMMMLLILWWVFYFFRSHSRFYKEKKWISRLKGICIMTINILFLLTTTLILIAYSALNVN
ncbi:DUF3667 domain-containing protein [Flavobacterium amniphilum]|uniref:DUF3667 domain-containing protein n=1 Tax=Flavobacterium amniphilum TaxID=1834035 RepID=UPI00202A445E|nr:DUF3667 domain-containing protein [Flavobacterium amniphilum]MCL9805558.1 DUF3667 domain-containing protein [Flavobacterium amniphilum]